MKHMSTIAILASLLFVGPTLGAEPREPLEPTPFEISAAWAQSLVARIVVLVEAGVEEPPPAIDSEQAPADDPDIDPGSGETHPIVEPAG